jgi:hypothetical protein
MPAKSEKQRRFMAAVANNPKFAKKVGVPQAVGEEFMKPKKMFLGGFLGRKTKDEPVKKATRRGRGPGRTRQTRMDDMKDAQDAQKPGGVSDRKQVFAKGALDVKKAPTTAPRPPKADAPAKVAAKKPPRPLRGTVTGKGGRNVGEGRDKRANVTREQLQETGMTLRQYLNFMDREGKRPPKKSGVDKVPNKKGPRKKMMRGGMMKSKMKAKGYKAGGKMKTKGYKAGGQMKEKSKFPDLNKDGKVTQADILQGRGVVKKKAGGMMKSKGYAKGGAMKTKGYAKGGMMKSKGYAKGGVAGGKKQKVRGAGIARRGVRPAKIR